MRKYLVLLKERGLFWVVCRLLYGFKLKVIRVLPVAERVFEKKTEEITRLNFFEYNVDELKKYLLSLREQQKKEIIQTANQACCGIIKGFSSIELNYGNPIQWQLNPLTGKTCSATDKWFRIADFDNERGDIKVIWEISRFSHFFSFVRAFLLTNDYKYVDAFFKQIDSWVRNNKYSYGANYKCGQECSIRMISCLLALPCFEKYASEKDIENIKEIVASSYKKVLSNFFYAYRCIKNNHVITELVGMIIGSWCCEDESRTNRAYRLLERVIREQFFIDGGYVQQSFNYQRLALQDLEILLFSEKKTGLTVSDSAKRRILKSVMLLYYCQDNNGDVPNYGANDGAFILPFTVGGYRDFRPSLNALHVLIKGTRLYPFKYLDEELIWFNYHNDVLFTDQKRETIDFPCAGLTVYRKDAFWAMIVCRKTIGHMDNGHIDLWIKGTNVLCDSGTYSYADAVGEELSTNLAHNTACCNNTTQIARIGSFSVCGQPKTISRVWGEQSFEFDVVYSTGYEHKRNMKICDLGIEIEDEIISNKSEKCFVFFHTPCHVNIENENTVNLGKCKLTFDQPYILTQAYRSLYYYQKEIINCIVVSCSRKLHTKITIYRKGDKEND